MPDKACADLGHAGHDGDVNADMNDNTEHATMGFQVSPRPGKKYAPLPDRSTLLSLQEEWEVDGASFCSR